MTDILKMDYINSLPQPLLAKLCGGDEWLVETIDVQTGCMRLDICGQVQHCHIGEVIQFIDIDGSEHDPDDFYIE